ncbi:methyl-CpG-binding domain protein 4-like protein [Iris pallida]|uniref:Methyl-CpG-binding domain protein 4-like protein n=1 Tax=Iris pallida TaxID=29817 RepID=A0AAX6IHZ1_IRIPA|nr:methyl-CpG-binding domain protein 4-like protein [Iris pallida]
MGESSSTRTSSPLDDFFAAFTYKGEGEGEGGREREREAIPIAISSSPNSVIPPPRRKKKENKNNNNNKKPSSSSSRFEPSSHLLTTIDGERRVVSSYFQLPPGASPPVVLDRRDVHRAYDARLRPHRSLVRRLLRRIDSAAANPDELDADEKLRSYKRRKQRSSLSQEEKKLDVYKRLTDSSSTNSWVPPPSPFGLLQEKHYFDPWRVLLICMLLNITTSRQVKGVLENLFARCPTAEALLDIQEEELQRMLKPLGLQNKRARAIKIFTQQYLGTEWTHVSQLYGVGKYAADAYAIFCVGKPEEVIPQDNKLVDYWKFVCEHNEKLEQQVCLGEVGFIGTGS